MWLVILNIILAFLLIAGIFCQFFLESGVKQLAKNTADILQNREKAFEAEKGRNLATKEDIEEITKKIEQVKAEISFENQWQHDHIRRREERLIHILHLSNKIMLAKNRIIIKSKNSYNVDSLFYLIDEIDSYAVELTDEGNMLVVDYHQFSDITPATTLIDTLTKYAAELSVLANNVANSLQCADLFKNRALETDADTSVNEMKTSIEMNNQAWDYVKAPLNFHEPTKKAITNYCLWLEKLYGEGKLKYYNISDITDRQLDGQ